ncbi:MAG: hypothetical protein LN588_00455, partial [Rickettsia endosymbiont of Bryobia graminum]|nr:hypothetical protein [Rickettsia endosymbiont of Bryobia graminum]
MLNLIQDNDRICHITPTKFADIIYKRSQDQTYQHQDIIEQIKELAYNWTRYYGDNHAVRFFNKQSVIDSIWALGYVNAKVHGEFIDQWVDQAVTMLNTLSTQELATVILGLSKINEIEVQELSITVNKFLNEWNTCALSNIDKSTAKDLSQYIISYKNFNFKPAQEFCDAWMNQATTDISNFNSQALSNSIYALSTLNIIPPQEFCDAWMN